MKNKYGFILVKPQIGENVGASARALKNFGFKNLIIIQPRDAWPNEKAKATSVGAIDVLKNTKIFDNTNQAIQKFDVIFSFSARKRDLNKKHIGINDFLRILKKTNGKKIGLMFGSEASGLSNYDLSFSNYVVQIPAAPKFKSINLSHSVFLISYEIFKLNNFRLIKQSNFDKKIGKKGNIMSVLNLLKSNLNKKDFFKPLEKRNSMLINMNNLFYRMEPNDKELRILASIIGTLSKNKKKHN